MNEGPGPIAVATILFLIFVIVAGTFLFIVRKSKNKEKEALRLREEHEQDLRRALLTTARVTSILNSNFLHNARGSVKVDIRFEVMPSEGNPYHAVSSWLVESMHIPSIQQGAAMQVKVDSNNKTKIYPAVPWAEYWIYD
jgi:hypothetical protein